jgi:hypothetical protein
VSPICCFRAERGMAYPDTDSDRLVSDEPPTRGRLDVSTSSGQACAIQFTPQ